MKINHLKIENINSLKGKHSIDFTKGLKGENLFAITGNTGSGKSTILLAIGLALYGRHYKNDINQSDFITLGEEFGSVTLEIEQSGKHYKCFWECKIRKANGQLLSRPKTKKIISENGKIIDKTATDIIGMDYTQFIKCVILNQGEFSKFLSSKYTERKSILEKLYQGQSFSTISKVIKESIKEKELTINSLTIESDNLIPFSTEEIEEIENEYQKNKNELSKLTDNFKYSSETIELLKTLCSLGKQSTNSEELIQKHKTEINKLKNNVNSQQKKEETITKAVKEKRIKVAKIEEEFKLKTELTEALKRKEARKSQEIKNIENITLTVDRKNALIVSKNSEIEVINTKLCEFKKEIGLSIPIEDLLKRREKLPYLQELQLKIKQIKEFNSRRKDELDLLQTELANEIENLKNINKTLNDNKEKLSLIDLNKIQPQHLIEVKNLEKEINNNKEDIANNKSLLDQNSLLIETTKSQKASQIHKINTLKDEIQKYYRDELIKELIHEAQTKKLCPVCTQSTINIKLSSPISTPLPNIKIEEDKLHKIDEQLLRVLSLGENSTATLKELKKQNVTKNELQKSILETYNVNSIKDLEIKAAKSLQNEQEVILLNEIITKNTIQKESKNEIIKEKEKRIAKLKNNNHEENEKVKIFWNQYQEACAEITIEADSHLDQLLVKTNKKLDLSREIEKIETKQENLQNDISRLEKEIKEHKTDIQTKRELIDAENNSEQKVRIKLKELTIPESMDSSAFSLMTKQLENLEIEADNAIKATRECEYSLAREERSASILKDNLISIRREITSSIENISEYKNKFEDETISNALNKISKTSNYDKFIAGLEFIIHFYENTFSEKHKKIEKEFTQKQLRLAELKSNYQVIEKQRKKRKEVDNKISALKKSMLPRIELQKLFGRDEFRGFALNMIEQTLINYTNSELENLLDGRYRLAKIEDKDDEYYVIDNHFEGTLRKSSTLSGGETFIVSLALAIGLAEMLKGGTEINSFFIDEGFGNLDSQSLDQVLDLLNDANNDLRKIGIISHVTKLTERIPVNILVKKQDDNSRTINFYYN